MTKPPFSRTSRGSCCSLMVVLAAFLILPLQARSQDVIVMKNGDRLTGEIKRLEHGQLLVDLDYVAGETVALDWLEVDRVESTTRWRISLQDGTRFTGTVEKVPPQQAPGEDFRIEEAGSRARIPATDVVEITSAKRSFWRQLKGSVGLGQSFTSGNGQSTLDVDADAKYDSNKYLMQTRFSSSISGQRDAEQTRRFETSFFGGRYLSRNDFVYGLLDFLHSSQQSLDLRTTLGSGYGRYLVRNNRTELAGFGGLVFTNEQFNPNIGVDTQQQNAEGLLGMKYSTFQFNKAEFETTVLLFPSISNAGRVRSSVNSSLTLKFVHDLNLRFSFWDNFDSNPPVSAKKNELGVSTTFGISF